MPRLPIFAMFGMLALDTSATAQPALPGPVTLSERVKPLQPSAANPPRPAINGELVLSIPDLTGPIRGEQEQILAQLINNTPDSEVEEKSDYYFRLGTLYAQQQRMWRIKSTELAIASDAAKDPQQKQKLRAESNAAANHAKMNLLKTVKTFKGLTDNDQFRNYPKLDMALFYYGYTLQSGKYMKEARAVYDKLLKNYPSSKYVPEAHLAFADYYFEAGQLADAEARYKMVLKFPKSTAYWYSMYKMGWIHLSLQRHQEALETFFQVAHATKNDAKQATLNRTATRDFTRAYAEIGKADKAHAAFERVDKTAALDMLEFLADQYQALGKYDKAVFTYRELLKSTPTSANVCRWQYNATRALLSTPGVTTADKVSEIERLARLYAGLKAQQAAHAEAHDCRANAAAMAGELGRAFHVESSKTLDVNTLTQAERLYRVYLDTFPDAQDFDEVQSFHAELSKTRTKSAAQAELLGWTKALEQVKLAKPPKKIPTAQPLAAREAKLIATFDSYAASADAGDEELVRTKLIKAVVLRRARQFDNAIPVLVDLLDNHRDHAQAELAANLLLDSLIQMRRFDQVLEVADKMAAAPGFLTGKDDLRRNIDFLRSRSLR